VTTPTPTFDLRLTPANATLVHSAVAYRHLDVHRHVNEYGNQAGQQAAGVRAGRVAVDNWRDLATSMSVVAAMDEPVMRLTSQRAVKIADAIRVYCVDALIGLTAHQLADDEDAALSEVRDDLRTGAAEIDPAYAKRKAKRDLSDAILAR